MSKSHFFEKKAKPWALVGGQKAIWGVFVCFFHVFYRFYKFQNPKNDPKKGPIFHFFEYVSSVRESEGQNESGNIANLFEKGLKSRAFL
jgi:hypothetical protein